MTRALIVEDNPRIMETVVDVVESLGHEPVTATCQDDARKLINGHPYAYALLDLEIPVKQGRNFPRIENGINLLRELVSHYGRQTPVIVMTAHGNDGPHQGVDCMKMGAADYIPKPFPVSGQTLDKAILQALENSGQSKPKSTAAKKPSGPPRPFEGGKLILFKRRVEICGVEVPISQMMHRILSRLSEKRSNGKYVAFAGSDLIELLDLNCGQNGIGSQILEFRNKSAERLLEEANITCERNSIIASGGPGYRLQEWITFESGTRPATRSPVLVSEQAAPDATSTVPSGDVLNERQRWALSQIEQGVKLQIRHVIEHFGCSSATAKRDLTGLKEMSLIRFVGSARAGHYRLTGEN
ncbi:MAG: response regulator [Planctomycetaceae bacterium]|nr:response regulator [Planctomycetaceae bacterium]MCA9091319.1 response regulator [Planctomycetaceae bacterium]